MAHQGRGKAAAVDEHQDLIAALEVFADQLGQRAGEAAFQWATADVEALEGWGLGIAGANGQAQVPVAALLHVVQALERWRRRAEDHRDLFQMAAVDREIPRVVAQTVLLFIGKVVFLIDDDQAGPRQRGEDRRAGTNNNGCVAVAGSDPGIQSLAIIQAGMENHHRCAEALLKAAQGLGGQADLRDQYQRLVAAEQAALNGLQIDLGLAAAGYPFQQPGMKALGTENRVQCRLLFGVGSKVRLP